ncbi:hypothetical protein F2Q69_00047907 [Brassica cretica]|uniref:Uncharacterized protein n=1 Tax=Brassica cretica TaxID=69181 RepID=A0A8S9PY67_BRACR|nr:hypothetical protein F2Q69_00047907 [Brassica cretica]
MLERSERMPEGIEAMAHAANKMAERDAQLEDKFQQEAEEPIYEFESLSECTVDENHILRSEEQAETVTFMSYYTNIDEDEVRLVENTLEDLGDDILPRMKQRVKSLRRIEQSALKNRAICTEESSKEVEEEESPVDKSFENNFGILSTKELKVDDPKVIPFEEIRMN